MPAGVGPALRSLPVSGPPERRRWRFRRAVARIEPMVEPLVAHHATSYWQRPARRHEDPPGPGRPDPSLRWSIDDETVLELRVPERGPSTLVVHDFGLFDPLRKALRTRHVRVRHATPRPSRR